MGAPIYTTAKVLDEVGFEPGEHPGAKARNDTAETPSPHRDTVSLNSDMSLRSIDSLKAEMQQAADNEDYETAARLKQEIDRRLNDDDQGNSKISDNPDILPF